MNSLEWRLKKLEDRVLGNGSNQRTPTSHIDTTNELPEKPIYDQIDGLAKHFKNFVDNECTNYQRFVDLYDKHANNINELSSDRSKAELVMAYEEELTDYLNKTKQMSEQADRVLNIDQWPDLSGYDKRLEKLDASTSEQLQQTKKLEDKTKELAKVYDKTIETFKNNQRYIWEPKLEAYENEERPPEE